MSLGKKALYYALLLLIHCRYSTTKAEKSYRREMCLADLSSAFPEKISPNPPCPPQLIQLQQINVLVPCVLTVVEVRL